MNSKIRVSYDYDKKEPYIKFQLDKDSEDLTDGMLKLFIESINTDGLRLQYPERADDNLSPEIRIGCRYLIPHLGEELLNFLNEDVGLEYTQHPDRIELHKHVDLFNLGVNFEKWRNKSSKELQEPERLTNE